MTNRQLINQTSGDTEIYTPAFIVEAARATMGGTIAFDPATSEIANKMIGALYFYTKESDALSLVWSARTLWMNHPFSRKENGLWIDKLVQSYKNYSVLEACCICFASTSEGWFQPLLDYPMCFLSPRTNYLRPDGTINRGVTKGSVVTYLGNNFESFKKNFSPLGKIKV